MFLVKYDTEGNFHWGITNAAAPNSLGYKVALDKQDSAYVVGWFEGDTTFSSNDGKEQTVTAFSGPVQSFPDYPDDAFLSKYDRYGNLKWVNHAGGYKAIADNVAASDDGRISITGLVGNVSSGQTSQAKTIITSQPGGADIDLGGGLLTNPYNWDLFIATYDGSGVLEGATRIGGANQDFGSGVAYDRDSNLYVTGVFAGSVDFGGQTLNGTGAHNSFVVKYRPRGHHGFANQLVWAQKIVGAGTLGSYQETGPRVWIEEGVHGDDHFGGSIVLAGDYQGTVSFGKYSFSSAGAEDVYLIRLNEIR
jgi:hypothetical protein